MECMQHSLYMFLYWVDFCVLYSMIGMNTILCERVELNLETSFTITVVIKCVLILILLSSLFRLPRPSPYLWGFGTFPCHSIGLLIFSAHIKLPLNILHQLPQLCHLPHAAVPRSPCLLSQSLKSHAIHIKWLWSSPPVPFLEFLLKVCAYICFCICSRCMWSQLSSAWVDFNVVLGGAALVCKSWFSVLNWKHLHSVPYHAESYNSVP